MLVGSLRVHTSAGDRLRSIADIIHPHDNSSVVFQPITYSTESMIIADLRYPHLHAELATLKSTVHFLVDHQNADGSWGIWNRDTGDLAGDNPLGFSPDADAIRSPRNPPPPPSPSLRSLRSAVHYPLPHIVKRS